MNDEQLKHHLTTIAEKDIPDDMDYLKAIHDTIGKRSATTRRQWLPLRLIIAAVIGLLLGGIGVYAIFQTLTDPGLEAVIEQGLVQEINQEQTINGVTVKVSRAYMDTNRVAIWYSISGGEDLLPENGSMYPLSTTMLRQTGSEDLFTMGGMFTQAGLDPDSDSLVVFDHDVQRPESGIYSLDFVVEIGGSMQTMLIIPPDQTPTPGPVPDEFIHSIPYVGEFIFSLELKASEPIILEPDMTITQNDIDITLQEVLIAPSQTEIVLCFELPDGRDWQPNTRIMIDGREGLPSGYGLIQLPSPEMVERCTKISFMVAYLAEDETMTITVDRLQTSIPDVYTPELFATASERLAEQGIVVTFELGEHGMRYEVIESPEGLGESEVGMAVFDALREHYAGLWEFTISLP
ncbi:MAG: DUF4179 domain-containing protein [Anaerolineaceae bacterium]|nr:DUF4179 domain-containing protein [Anaerolineaceae bacterium]